jgi:hypothetical protein
MSVINIMTLIRHMERHRRHFVFQEGLTRVSTCDIKTSDYENILVKMKELEDARR